MRQLHYNAEIVYQRFAERTEAQRVQGWELAITDIERGRNPEIAPECDPWDREPYNGDEYGVDRDDYRGWDV